jgi:hypothetical protein
MLRVTQHQWSAAGGWPASSGAGRDAQLVMTFGARQRLADPDVLAPLRARFPKAAFFGCSTSGEIAGTTVSDDTVVASALAFDRTEVRLAATSLAGEADSDGAGRRLAADLASPDLTHVFVLSDGLHVNGSALAAGLAAGVGPGAVVTGGLAGDGTAFADTAVVAGPRVGPGLAAAIGLYGPHVRVGCASLGGWDPFGPERIVTRARGNVLFELDGQSALGLYRRYLGRHAADLPASALLFPLAVREAGQDPIVRTVLSVDESEESMTFAGDVPEGARARLMKANFDRLIDGATGAARVCQVAVPDAQASFALLISCVGRRLVLKQRTEEEVEAVRDVVGPQAVLAGFYSYGEISPFTPGAQCRLHNQTMTITTLSEP